MTLYESDPRSFALDLCDEGLVDARHLLLCALKYMSHDDVQDMLDCNELSPRFNEEEEFELDQSNHAHTLGCMHE